MTANFLRSLIAESQRTAMGIVPSVAEDGRRRARITLEVRDAPRAHLEPLAAVYPRTALAIADECLRNGEFQLKAFIRKLEAIHLVRLRPVAESDAAFLTNWNAPEDIA